MASTIWQGLCVGGPRNGRHVIAERPTLNIPLPPPFEQSIHVLPQFRVIDHFDYQHVTFDFAEEGEIGSMLNGVVYGFWVPAGERHPRRYVLDTLAKAYGGGNG